MDEVLTRQEYHRFKVLHQGKDEGYVSVPLTDGTTAEEIKRQASSFFHHAKAVERTITADDVEWWMNCLARGNYFGLFERVVWRLVRGMIDIAEDDGTEIAAEKIDTAHARAIAAVRRKVHEDIRRAFADIKMQRAIAKDISIHITTWTSLRVETDLAITGQKLENLTDEEYNQHFLAVWEEDDFLADALDQCFWHIVQREATRIVESIAKDQAKQDIDRLFDRAAQEARERTARRLSALPALTQDTIRQFVGDRFISVDNSPLYHFLRMALSNGSKSFLTPPNGLWPTADLCSPRQSVKAFAQLKPHPTDVEPFLTGAQLAEWQARIAEYVMMLDDRTADVFDAISALWLSQATHPDMMANLHADNFLRLRGLQPHRNGQGRRGGYNDEDRRDIATRIETLKHTHVTVQEMDVTKEKQGKRGLIRERTKWQGESPAIMVSFTYGQSKLGGGTDPYAWRIRPGDVFSQFLMGPGRQTALLSLKALEYDPYRQRWEKRIARYLAWLWRIRRDGSYLDPIAVGTLLTAIREEVYQPKPLVTKNRLEKALDTLHTDGVTAGWQYGLDADEAIIGHRRWVDRWLEWKLTIEPPTSIQQHYINIPSHKTAAQPARALPRQADIGAEIKTMRTSLGLTQLQAAEEIGIDNALLSRIEGGKSIGPKTRRKIEAWLTQKNQEGIRT